MLWGVYREQRQAENEGHWRGRRAWTLEAPRRSEPFHRGVGWVFRLGYSALLGTGLALSAPWWLFRMATTARYREGLRERLGWVPPRLRTAVTGRRVVWVHAVSVGEVLAVSRLVTELETALKEPTTESLPSPRFPQAAEAAEAGEATTTTAAGTDRPPFPAREAWQVVISTTTRTGQALARERFGAERVFYLPFDFAWAVRAYLRVLRPAMVVLAESEIWPRLLFECGRLDVPVAVVNARVSDRSLRRGLWVRRVWKRVLRGVSLWLAQSAEDAVRLERLGVQAERVRVSGNLKYDVRVPGESRMAERIQTLAAGRPIVVAGSTVPGSTMEDKVLSEDASIIRAWKTRLRDRGVLLVLAPRHPERFSAVYATARAYPTLRATELLNGNRGLGNGDALQARESEICSGKTPIEIVVLDTIGDLAAVYGVADVAFVGGSLVPQGGHNPLEPARFGVPVVMGPSYENFREIVEGMKAAEGIVIAANEDELAAAFDRWWQDREAAHALGERGRKVFAREGGATARSIQALMPFIRKAESSRPLAPEAVSA